MLRKIGEFYHQYLYHNYLLASLFTLIIVFFLYRSLIDDEWRFFRFKTRWTLLNHLLNYLLLLAGISLMIAFSYVILGLIMWPFTITDFLIKWLPVVQNKRWLKYLLFFSLLLLSYLLYKLKQQSKIMIGLMYVMGGVATLIGTFRKLDAEMLTAVGIGGGIFLIIDGLSNIKEGDEELKKRTEERKKATENSMT